MIDKAARLPDGSGVMTGSFPLPKDHWIYNAAGDGSGEPPMPMRMGTVSPFRNIFRKAIREAAKYAVRASTACGTDNDFDPDAILNNMVVGLLGYNTQDGLAGDFMDQDASVVPRLFASAICLPEATIKDIALANGFVEKPQPDGKPDDLHPYVYLFANAIAAQVVQQFIGELGMARFLSDVPLPDSSVAKVAE